MARGRGGAVGRHGRARGRGRPRGGNSVRSFLDLHTGRQAARVANAEAGAEYNPEIRNLREEAKGSRARQRDLGRWYARLAADYGQAQREGSRALRSVEGATTRQLAEAGAGESAERASLAGQDAAFSRLTGAPTDTAGLATIARASTAARRARAEQAALPESEQADFVASLGSRKTAARMQGIESRQAEAQRRGTLKSNLTAVRKEKGAARVSDEEKLREADRAYQSELASRRLARREAASSERQAAAEAALAGVEAARQAREEGISDRQAQERIGISRRSQRATARHYRQEGSSGGLTASEIQAAREGRHNAVATAKSLIAKRGKPIKNAAEWAELEEAVRKESEVSPADARRAVAALREEQAAKRRAAYGRRHLKSVAPLGQGRG